ncbi:hypothetical protein DL96DRAFT_1677505 [Flagelloscypha sp. PMI_526]|nr:hypothetical protein DL96DRAFT_1677505 [Flagelloscypha sp. PMI_526]
MTFRLPCLSARKQEIAEKGAEELFYYSVAVEEHAAILRKDLDALPAVYADYHAKYQPGTDIRPPPEIWDAAVDSAKKVVAQPCNNPTDHLLAQCSAMFLVQAVGDELFKQGHDIYAVATYLKTQKENAFFKADPEELLRSYSYNPTTHPSFASAVYNARPAPPRPQPQLETAVQYPLALQVTKVFTWNDIIQHNPPILVTTAQITDWRCNPEPVQQHTFIAKYDSETKAFKVACFLTVGNDRIFYVQFVEDDEAIGFTTDYFFELLEGAELALPSHADDPDER